FWVQWHKENQWIDLDASFADAKPGQTCAKLDETLDSLPEKAFHRVELRVRLEESAIYLKGNEVAKPDKRVILTYKTRAMDLSGVDVMLTHQPENWKGPARDVQG